MTDTIIEKFYEYMKSVEFNAYGILDTNNNIHTLGTDSKIIGRIFEMFAQPVLEKIASDFGYVLATPASQTVYPDFILMKDKNSKEKIAIDIKTTYVDTDNSAIKFTLGSFGSYMRNNTKNIEFQYTDYSKHYVIGFVYKRNDSAQESRVYNITDKDKVIFPYYDVRYFMEEKYKIAGDKPGSGNTENIGSISTRNFDDFRYGRGPFSELGQDAFDIYWKYYPKYRSTDKAYTSLSEFLNWLPQNISSVSLFHPFDSEKLLQIISDYKKK